MVHIWIRFRYQFCLQWPCTCFNQYKSITILAYRCSECGTTIEEYSDEEIGLCIVTLGTFIHREPALAAPLLPDILNIVAKYFFTRLLGDDVAKCWIFRVATNTMYPWQSESNIHLPGSAVSVAHQFLRCVLHQLAPNGIFTQMFQTHTTGNHNNNKFVLDQNNLDCRKSSSSILQERYTSAGRFQRTESSGALATSFRGTFFPIWNINTHCRWLD